MMKTISERLMKRTNHVLFLLQRYQKDLKNVLSNLWLIMDLMTKHQDLLIRKEKNQKDFDLVYWNLLL